MLSFFLKSDTSLSRRGPAQIIFHLNGHLNMVFLGYLTSSPPFLPTPAPPQHMYKHTHTSVFPSGCWVVGTGPCMCLRQSSWDGLTSPHPVSSSSWMCGLILVVFLLQLLRGKRFMGSTFFEPVHS